MSNAMDEDGEPRSLRRFIAPAVAIAVVLLLAAMIYRLASDKSGVTREQKQQAIVALLPPPPPPPPPPPSKERPPEPETPPKEATPTPQQTPTPKVAQSTPQNLTINGPAQAGGDAFGVQAGSGGGGMVGGGAGPGGPGTGGGGFGDAAYGRYLGSMIQQAVQGDDRVNHQVFSAEVAVWLDPQGKVTKASILKGTGDGKTDRSLLATLEGLGRLEEPPPASMKFPQRVTIRGRRA